MNISLHPLDVGFDLRTTGHTVVLKPEHRSATIEHEGRRILIAASSHTELAKKLRALGFTVAVESPHAGANQKGGQQ